MQKAKPYILPLAIVLGLLLHSWAFYVAWLIPYVIFTILLLNFTAVDITTLKFNRLDLLIMIFQTVVSIGGYALLRAIGASEVIAQGWLIGVLCPVASSVVVVCAALGADRRTTTGYTIYGNLLVTIVAPIYFSFIGTNQDMPFAESALTIFEKIASVIALPFFIALLMQFTLPKAKVAISRFKEWAFYLWAFALIVTIGQTIDYIFLYHQGNGSTIVWLGVIAVVLCAVQFAVGKAIGRRYGEEVAGGQMTGQKNTAIGIWMTSFYLMPLASVVLAFYAIVQNIFNSWQIYRYQHRNQ